SHRKAPARGPYPPRSIPAGRRSAAVSAIHLRRFLSLNTWVALGCNASGSAMALADSQSETLWNGGTGRRPALTACQRRHMGRGGAGPQQALRTRSLRRGNCVGREGGRHRVVGSVHRHRAGRDGDSEHLGDAGVVKAVLHLADGPDKTILSGSRVRGRLERCLVRAQARFLIYLGARIPEQNLGGDVAGDWLAAVVEQGDAFLPGSVEQVVGLY